MLSLLNVFQYLNKPVIKDCPEIVNIDTVSIDTTKIDKKIITSDSIIKPKVKYKKSIITPPNDNKVDSTTTNVNLKDYEYSYDTTIVNNNVKTHLNIIGGGYLDSIKIDNEIEYSEMIIEKVVEKTIKLPPTNKMYLSGQYLLMEKPIYNAVLDYTIKDIMIGGVSLGIQGKEPVIGLKLGFKIK